MMMMIIIIPITIIIIIVLSIIVRIMILIMIIITMITTSITSRARVPSLRPRAEGLSVTPRDGKTNVPEPLKDLKEGTPQNGGLGLRL